MHSERTADLNSDLVILRDLRLEIQIPFVRAIRTFLSVGKRILRATEPRSPCLPSLQIEVQRDR